MLEATAAAIAIVVTNTMTNTTVKTAAKATMKTAAKATMKTATKAATKTATKAATKTATKAATKTQIGHVLPFRSVSWSATKAVTVSSSVTPWHVVDVLEHYQPLLRL